MIRFPATSRTTRRAPELTNPLSLMTCVTLPVDSSRAEPPGRKAGVKVKTVAELIDRLKNEAGVI